MPIVLLNELHLCQLRLVVGSDDFEVEINELGEITSWTSASSPNVPAQAELDAAAAQLSADPSICETFGFGDGAHPPLSLSPISDPRLTLDTAEQELSLDLSDLNQAQTDIDALELQAHNPVTLAGTSDPELTLTGQELNLDLSTINAGIGANSGDIQVNSDDIDALELQAHNPVTLATGSAAELTLVDQELNLDLSGIEADISTNATDIANLQTSNHPAITLGVGSDPALALSGQELVLTLPHGIDHNEVTLATGSAAELTLTDQELNLDLSPIQTQIDDNSGDITALQSLAHPPISQLAGTSNQFFVNPTTQEIGLNCPGLLAEAVDCTQLSFVGFPTINIFNEALYTHVGIINQTFGRDFRWYWNGTQDRWISTFWHEFWSRNDATVNNGTAGRLAMNGVQGSFGIPPTGTADATIGLELLDVRAGSRTITNDDITIDRVSARTGAFFDAIPLQRYSGNNAGGTVWRTPPGGVPIELDDEPYQFQKSVGPSLNDLTVVLTLAYRSTV